MALAIGATPSGTAATLARKDSLHADRPLVPAVVMSVTQAPEPLLVVGELVASEGDAKLLDQDRVPVIQGNLGAIDLFGDLIRSQGVTRDLLRTRTSEEQTESTQNQE